MTEERKREVFQHVFDLYATGSPPVIGEDAVKPAFDHAGLNAIEEEQLEDFVNHADKDGSGLIEFKEFEIVITLWMEETFKKFSKNGEIAEENVKPLFEYIGLTWITDEQIEEIANIADADGSAKLEHKEFEIMYLEAISLKSKKLQEEKEGVEASEPDAGAARKRDFAPETKGTIFVLLAGSAPKKYFDLTVQAIKFLKRNIKAQIGIITPPGTGDLVPKIQESLDDPKLDVSDLVCFEGKKHFDDWGNSQLILDLQTVAEEYDPVIFLDSDTVIIKDILPQVENFKNSGKKYAFLKHNVQEYPNFSDNWEGEQFVPQTSLILFRSEFVPQLFSAWESNWKEWIEPAPFVNKKDPARFYKQTRQSIGQYSLGQTLFQVGTFDDDVEVLVRRDLSFCHNLAPDAQAAKAKFLLGGSSWAKDGQSKITLNIQSGKVNEMEDVTAKEDSFVTVKVGSRERSTKHAKSELPEWNEKLAFDGATYADAANVLLILEGSDGSKNDEIGTATLSLLEARTNMPGGNILQHYSVPVKDQDGEETGSIELDAIFYVEQLPEDEDDEDDGEPKARGFAAVPEGPGYDGVAQVTFNVAKAEIYEKHDPLGKDDPYVQIKIGNVTKRTKTIDGTQNPVWNETVVFEGVKSANAQAALITIWDDDLVTHNDLIGSLTVDLLPYKGAKRQHVTLVLKDGKGKAQAKLDLDVVLTPKG